MRRCAPRPLFCASSVTCWSLVNWTCKGSVWTNQAPVLCFFKEREPVVPWRSWWPLRALGAFIDDDSLLMVLAGQPRGVDELSFRGCISFNGDCHAPCVQRIRLLSIPLPCAVMHKRSRPICAARRGPPAQLGNFLRRGYFSFFFRHVGRSFFFFFSSSQSVACPPPSLSLSFSVLMPSLVFFILQDTYPPRQEWPLPCSRTFSARPSRLATLLPLATTRLAWYELSFH